ncbi:glycosyltransferase [Aliikangiella sp. IMCC44653]
MSKQSVSNQPLKVLQIASGDLWAGAEAQLFTLCDSLKHDFSQQVCVILLNHGELETRLKSIGIKVYVINESQFNIVKIIQRCIRIIKTEKPQIIHTHRFKENIIGAISAKFCNSIATLRSCHGHAEHHYGFLKVHKKLLNLVELWMGEYWQKYIVAVSEQLAESLSHQFSKDKIKVIENGVNTRAIEAFLQSYNPPTKQPKRVAIVGRLVPVKRVDCFIELAHYWQQNQSSEVEFIVYGDGPLAPLLKQQANDLQLNNIQFAGHTQEIYAAIASLDALVIVSDHEGLPMTLLEAMAIGTPIMSVKVGGIPAALKQGECGLLVDSQTPQVLAQGLDELLTNQTATQAKVSAAKQNIELNYSAKNNAGKFLKLYDSMLKN